MKNDSTVIKGSCLCGSVQYVYRNRIDHVVICHCDQCKKAQGSVFATNAPVALNSFAIESGEDLLQTYRSSPGKRRVFCSNCGSPIYSAHDDKPEVIRLRVGTIDTKLDCTPDYQQYTESKADWLEFKQDIPAYERGKVKPQ